MMDEHIDKKPIDLTDFEKELTKLINNFSIENTCNTPDFILAKYLTNCIRTFAISTTYRDNWYKKEG